jgi:4,5-DOPA dioxygenase extradiol
MLSEEVTHKIKNWPDKDYRMPALFIGHGSPMNAVEDNEFARSWNEIGHSLPKPTAIICISAHWETTGTWITAMVNPRTIHDFYGFPEQLYEKLYPAKGSPQLAELVSVTVQTPKIQLDQDWGLDHGTWSVLCRMFPEAGIPVLQISLDRTINPSDHYQLATGLKLFRQKGILVIGSGNIVHNLRTAVFEDVAYDWAVEFDEKIKECILSGDHNSIIEYKKFGKIAQLSVPTNEHFLPLLYILALQNSDEKIEFYTDKITMGSLSMRSIKIG